MSSASGPTENAPRPQPQMFTFFTFAYPVVYVSPIPTESISNAQQGDVPSGSPFHMGDMFFNVPLSNLFYQFTSQPMGLQPQSLQGQPPASPNAIQSLPKLKIPNPVLKQLSRNCSECVICQDSIIPGENESVDPDTITVMPCNHLFHTSCIQPWLSSSSNTCPTCRYPLETSNPEYNKSVVAPAVKSYKAAYSSSPVLDYNYFTPCSFTKTGLCEHHSQEPNDSEVECANLLEKVLLKDCGCVFHESCLTSYDIIRNPSHNNEVRSLVGSTIRCPECRVESQVVKIATPAAVESVHIGAELAKSPYSMELCEVQDDIDGSNSSVSESVTPPSSPTLSAAPDSPTDTIEFEIEKT
ncbi:hypothetical protein BKA69DRAFT_560257 [Paraphysoderma sedebokerense]|nr:hypothetical protein BKA69DRAFT_560257 [Paraphysoderma sedebokerense]